MSIAEIKNKERVINELMLVLRKIMVEPEICTLAMKAARDHLKDEHANIAIAEALSASSNVKIPIEHSEADTLFLEMLKELVRDEQALY